jgi:dihydroflavonol-4-reductase
MDPRDEVLDETRRQVADSPRHSAYDRSKALGERIVLEQVEAGLDAVIVNPTGIMGPVDFGPSRLGQLLVELAGGKLPALLDGGTDFVDVRDVVAGILAAGERGRCGENYILGNAWYSLAALAQLVEAAGGARAPRLVTPVWAARLGVPLARIASRVSGREPMFTHESLEVLVSNRSISSGKARAELGYAPRPLPETVADMLTWLARKPAQA